MLVDHFPLLGLRVTSGDLELRLPEPQELAALADLAADGVHRGDEMPFVHPWTAKPPAEVAREVVQSLWTNLGAWEPDSWSLPLTVFRDGEPLGVQAMRADQFSVLREVTSHSWLGLRHHGRGLGTRMRRMMLHLAFAGLGAQAAFTFALDTNPASAAVSRKCGYVDNGINHYVVRGVKTLDHAFRLERERWERTRPDTAIELHGVEPCLRLFGAEKR